MKYPIWCFLFEYVKENFPNRGGVCLNGLSFNKSLDSLQDIEFSIIIGEDNFDNLHRWEDHEEIISNHRILVYPRRVSSSNIPPDHAPNKGGKIKVGKDQVVVFTQAPMIAISSSYIREAILDKQDIQYLLPDPVISYIGNNHLYEKNKS